MGKYHFIAIGGIGMSGLAKYLLEDGHTVSGSDITNTKYVDKLRKLGATVNIGHSAENVPKDSICILLAHHPEFIDDAIKFKIPLTLTGHTHGSQIGFFGVPLFPVFKYTRGMFINGDCYGYVHCGNGSWFPFRLGCPPEIAYFTLRNK